MKKLFFTLFMLINFKMFTWQLACPHGCSQVPVADLVLTCLKNVELLELSMAVYTDTDIEEYEKEFSGEGWELTWRASHESSLEEDDDGGYDEFHTYSFSTHKVWTDHAKKIERSLSTQLNSFFETGQLLKYLLDDISFLLDEEKKSISESIDDYKEKINKKDNVNYYNKLIRLELTNIKKIDQNYIKKINILENTQNRIYASYQKAFEACIKKHKWSGSFYSRGLIYFDQGQFIDAFDDVVQCIELTKKESKESVLPEEVYFNKGVLESELGCYDQAILSLSRSIENNPKAKEAYLERAAAYFERGDFELALEDYLASGFQPKYNQPISLELLAFTSGLWTGIHQGGIKGAIEYIPNLLSSLQGLGSALWAFLEDPIQVSGDFAEAALACIEFVKNNTPKEVLEELVPEFQELIEHWEELEYQRKGEMVGYIIGKYSIELFAGATVAKGVRAYRNLKRANNLLTFETAAMSSRHRSALMAEAAKKAATRKQILQSANLRIHWDSQGKHIPGHRNFKVSENKSILEHPNPQKLINDFAGKGLRIGPTEPGLPNYTEVVNFHEFIGYSIERNTGKKIATQWGKIHYGKNGVHIVPTNPRS